MNNDRLSNDTEEETPTQNQEENSRCENISEDPADKKIEAQKGINVFDLIYGVLFTPVLVFRKMAGRTPLKQSFLVYTAVILINTLMSVFVIPNLYDSSLSSYLTLALAIIGFLLYYLKWFVYSGFLFLICEFMEGKGRAGDVLAVTGFAALPSIISVPVFMFLLVSGVESGTAVNILMILGVITWLWGGVLIAIGLKEVQSISGLKAALTVGLLPLTLFVIAIVLFIFIFLVVASSSPVVSTPFFLH